MNSSPNSATRHIETRIYLAAWVVVIGLYVLNNMLADSNLYGLANWRGVMRIGATLLPLLTLFIVNNYVLIPRLIYNNQFIRYSLWIALAVLLVWSVQAIDFFNDFLCHHRSHHIPMPPPRQIFPMPLLISLVYDLLVVGANLAVALIFQRIEDRFESERLKQVNIEEQLTYLKAQINPHFYMNMLNNIHGMIDIDTEKAQDMVIEMSRLMRYMLYDSSRQQIDLSEEVSFIENYLNIMRHRFPADRVSISAQLPTADTTGGVMIAPLLFLVFIENSFKHGISYRDKSFIDLKIEIDKENVRFVCRNSVPQSPQNPTKDGIGLRNVQRRLKLIYGERANLAILNSEGEYTVNLTIPRL